MSLKLSKTALRELTRFYRAILMGVIISGFISVSANATVAIEDGTGGTVDVYTSDEVDEKLTSINIGTDQIVDGSVSTNDLANKAVTSDKIDTSAVGQNHIADASVGTGELIDKSVTTSKLDDTLQANINQIGTNTSAIAENKGAIDILNGDANTTGSVAKTVADAVSTKQDKLSDTQMNAVNSGITTDKVATYDAYAAKIEAVQTGKADATTVYTKTEVETKISETKAYAENKASTAEANAKTYTNEQITAAKTYAEGQANTAETNAKAYAENKASTAETNAKSYTDTLANGAVATNTTNISANKTAIETLTGDANTAGSVANIASGYANTAEANAKSYTDTQVADAKTYTNEQITAAKTYADEKAAAAEAGAKSYTDTLANGAVATNTANIATNTTNISANKTAIDILNGDETVDGSVAKAVKTAETNANAYTDAQDAETLASAKTYTDTQDAATLATAQADASAKATAAETNAKSYTDTLIGTTDVLVEQNGVIKLGTVNENIAALNETIGNVTNLNQYAEGSSIGNALTQGGTQSADTIVAALNNIDATLGTIHGLRDKLAASGAGTNLASGTTVEQHLTALDSAIGNRAYTSTRYITSGSDLSTAVSSLDSNLSRVEGNLDALTNRTNKMHHEMKSGFASLAAMSALVPNARVAGDTQISVGAGHYRGTTGFALGAFHHVNDNVLLNAGAAYGGNGSATFKGGLTFGW